MADRNEVILEGALTKAAEIRYTTGGKAVTSLNLITLATFNGREIGNYHDVVAWGEDMAEKLAGLDKGARLRVEGRLVKSSYDGKDGKKVWTVKVNANSVDVLSQAQAQAADIDDIPF